MALPPDMTFLVHTGAQAQADFANGLAVVNAAMADGHISQDEYVAVASAQAQWFADVFGVNETVHFVGMGSTITDWQLSPGMV